MGARLTRIVAALLFPIGLLAGCGTAATGPKNWDDHTQGLPFEVGYDRGMKAASNQNKPAMVFVTTTWCGWCKKLANENFNDSEVKQLLTNFVCVIVDGDVETAAAKKLGADGLCVTAQGLKTSYPKLLDAAAAYASAAHARQAS